MAKIPILTEEQRIESFMKTRLNDFDNLTTFSKKELARFILKEIDYACDWQVLNRKNQILLKTIQDLKDLLNNVGN